MKASNWSAKMSSSYFHIFNYIIGIPDSSVAPMTIGANGIKVYTAIDYATIWSNDLTFSYFLHQNWTWKAQFAYNLGKDNNNEGLPFMSPFSYLSSVTFNKNKFNAAVLVRGNTTQTEFNPFYGEDKTKDYAVLNLNFGYKFNFEKAKMIFNTGMENVLDTQYTTYTDWKNLPRMGRNMFVNLMIQF